MARLPSLNGLRAFEAAGRHLSVTRAATELCVSQAAVSRQIRQLEEQLGVQLFARGNRGLGFTELGRHYFETVSPALADIQRATRALAPAAATPARRLVMAVDGAFNATWLVRRLGAFRSRHPDIEVEVMVTRPLATSFYLLVPQGKNGHWVLDAFSGWLTEELAASVA